MEIMHRLKNNNAEVVTTEEPCFKLVNRKQQLQWFADQVYIGASIRLKFTSQHTQPLCRLPENRVSAAGQQEVGVFAR